MSPRILNPAIFAPISDLTLRDLRAATADFVTAFLARRELEFVADFFTATRDFLTADFPAGFFIAIHKDNDGKIIPSPLVGENAVIPAIPTAEIPARFFAFLPARRTAMESALCPSATLLRRRNRQQNGEKNDADTSHRKSPSRISFSGRGGTERRQPSTPSLRIFSRRDKSSGILPTITFVLER